jgi:hypothetical protein
VHWTYDAAAASLSVAFLAAPPSGGWVAWGLNPTGDGMSGTQALVAVPKGRGAYEVQTYSISGYSLGSPGPLSYNTSDLAAEIGSDGRVRIFGTLKLQNGTGEVNQVWQVGPSSGGAIGIHSTTNADNLNSKGKLNLLTGASTAASGGNSILRKRNVSYSISGLKDLILHLPVRIECLACFLNSCALAPVQVHSKNHRTLILESCQIVCKNSPFFQQKALLFGLVLQMSSCLHVKRYCYGEDDSSH